MSVTPSAPPTAPAAPVRPRRNQPEQRRFLPEVQGLRAVAVLLVVVYHLNGDLLPGGYVGVDVFFVISGFLITTLLVRELHSNGRVSLARFYIRRVRRILPAATLVLLATAAATFVLLPSTRLETAALELIASAAYAENLILAGQEVDYLAAETAPSPVQHYWSLAVEEQFYLVWPLLFLGWAALRRRTGRADALVWGAVAAIIAVSFACSVVLTATDPTAAYFLPHTRVWELGVGGALALVLTRWSPPAWACGPLGWAGLAAVCAAALHFSSATAFPGWAAAVPVLGTAAVIAAGGSGRFSAGRLLGTGPARFVGDISYSLYLWHWPLIVIFLGVRNTSEPTPLEMVLLLTCSLLLAWGTKIAVEDPIREKGLLNTGRSAAVFALSGVLLVSAAGWGLHADAQRIRATAFDPAVHVGPEALGPSDTAALDTMTAPLYPSAVAAEDDLPDLYADDCQGSETETRPHGCVYGPKDAETAVAIVGDSHASHWTPALQEVAERRDWRLHTFTKSSCAFTTALLTRPNGQPYDSCPQWNEGVVQEIEELAPAIVFTSSSAKAEHHDAPDREAGTEEIAEGMANLWTRIEAAGSEVVVLRDTPRTRPRIVECVELNPDTLGACTPDMDEAFQFDDPQLRAVAMPGNDARVVDLTDRFCSGGDCPAVVGNVLVYRDSHHLTATYARLLADDLDQRLTPVL